MERETDDGNWVDELVKRGSFIREMEIKGSCSYVLPGWLQYGFNTSFRLYYTRKMYIEIWPTWMGDRGAGGNCASSCPFNPVKYHCRATALLACSRCVLFVNTPLISSFHLTINIAAVAFQVKTTCLHCNLCTKPSSIDPLGSIYYAQNTVQAWGTTKRDPQSLLCPLWTHATFCSHLRPAPGRSRKLACRSRMWVFDVTVPPPQRGLSSGPARQEQRPLTWILSHSLGSWLWPHRYVARDA